MSAGEHVWQLCMRPEYKLCAAQDLFAWDVAEQLFVHGVWCRRCACRRLATAVTAQPMRCASSSHDVGPDDIRHENIQGTQLGACWESQLG